MTMRQLVEQTPSRPDWLWEGYLAPGSITVFHGDPKAGKSTLLYGLLGALESGTPFAGSLTRKTNAIVLSEEPDDTISEKVRRFGAWSHHIIKSEMTYGIEWVSLVDWAADQAIANGSGMIMVDTFARMSQIRDEEENDAGAVLARLAPLQRAASRGLSILLVVHSRKSGGRHGLGVRGSSALPGAANVIVELQRVGDGAKRTLKGIGHYEDIPELRTVELRDAEYVVLGNEAGKARNRMLVLAAFDALGTATDKQLFAHLNKNANGPSLSTVTRARISLIETGEVEPAGGDGV